jgi:hypothetical protein
MMMFPKGLLSWFCYETTKKKTNMNTTNTTFVKWRRAMHQHETTEVCLYLMMIHWYLQWTEVWIFDRAQVRIASLFSFVDYYIHILKLSIKQFVFSIYLFFCIKTVKKNSFLFLTLFLIKKYQNATQMHIYEPHEDTRTTLDMGLGF